MKREEIFGLLKIIGTSFAKMLGSNCEILIHDLSYPEKSIIWMEGNVTGRKVGGPLTHIGLDILKNNSVPKDLINYSALTEDGRTLKSSTIYLRDEHGKVFGIFCINIDISQFYEFQKTLNEIVTVGTENRITKKISPDVDELLETLIEDGCRKLGVEEYNLNQEERLELVKFLDSRGVFRIRKSVPLLAKRLGISRYTIYNDLKKFDSRN